MRSQGLAARALFAPFVAALLMSGCAGQECDFNSQCGTSSYCLRGRCRQDCRRDFDCADEEMCSEIGMCVPAVDGGPLPPDAGPVDAGDIDAGPPPGDSGPPPPEDGGPSDGGPPPTPDSGPPPTDAGGGTARYLDRCTTGADCESGRCVDDVGGTSMCTIACTVHADCASEHVCGVGGVCVPDDTGTACTRAADCELNLCAGNPAAGAGQCTRPCTNASDCPGGFACANAGGAFVCVDIERPCTAAAQCPTGLCLSGGLGCTTVCRGPADCPGRLPILPAYSCAPLPAGGDPVCIPPSDIQGSDPIGTSCPAAGTTTCRSGACDTGAPTGPMCTQSCTQEGGCAAGLGCFPSPEDTTGNGSPDTILFVCSRAGSRPLGAACSSGSQCDSGMCDSDGLYCTRLCTDDALCSSDMSCRFVPGFAVSVCRR